LKKRLVSKKESQKNYGTDRRKLPCLPR